VDLHLLMLLVENENQTECENQESAEPFDPKYYDADTAEEMR